MSTAFDASVIKVQEQIFFLELPPGAQPVSERGLREAVLGTIDTPARNPRS